MRPAPRHRILSLGAAAALSAGALTVVLSPPAEVDPLGTLGRADASGPAASTAAVEAPVPSAFGVAGVDLAALGYHGPDLDAVTVASLSEPFSALPTERAADIRDRIARATPQLQALHLAKNLLARAVPAQDHHVHAAQVVTGAAEEAWAAAKAELAATRARLDPPPPAPEEGGPDHVEPDAAGSAVVALAAAPAEAHDPTVPASPAEQVARAVAITRAEARVAETDAVRRAAWVELEARRERRRGYEAAAAAAEHDVWRMDAHVRWLRYEQWLAQGAMPSAGNWLVLEERGDAELPIVEVRRLRVHRALADSVRQLVDEAAAAGIDLRGTGYRPVSRQVELRRQNCGPTHFDIYERSPSTCSPPTAKPGRSLHELGLAVDLQNGDHPIVSRRDPAFRWLAAHAPSYGLYNLPAEPWHWSITGQ